MLDTRPDSDETVRLLERAAEGDASAVDDLLAGQRDAIRAFVAIRLDPAIKHRVDPSDVAQEVLAEASDRLEDYLKRRPMPFHVWIRKVAYERAIKVHRFHRAERRDVEREVHSLDHSSYVLIQSIVANEPTPSEDVQAREFADRVTLAVSALDDEDREILALRQVDNLPHREIAMMLDISEVNARQRYGRALIRLQEELRNRDVIGGDRS